MALTSAGQIQRWSHICPRVLGKTRFQQFLVGNQVWRSLTFNNLGRHNHYGNRRKLSSLEAKEDDYMVLYQRNSDRNTIPRAAFGVSLFNTIYWTWYSLDFIPAVNASPIEDLHIDPAVGLAGVALGILINSVTLLYPMTLTSKLAFSPTANMYKVWMHDLPFITPSKQSTEYLLGGLSLDHSSSDVKKILTTYDGDLRQYSGHLGIAIKGKKIPMLVEIRDREELLRPKLMLQALVNPQDVIGRETRASSIMKKRKGAKQPNRRKK
jgi:hypothetical protein